MHVYRLIDPDGKILIETRCKADALTLAKYQHQADLEVREGAHYNGNNYGQLRWVSRETISGDTVEQESGIDDGEDPTYGHGYPGDDH